MNMNIKDTIQKWILNSIKTKEYLYGEKILSEKQISIKFNCSRTTVRNSLTPLVYVGILKSINGFGYIVSDIGKTNSLHSFKEAHGIKKSEIKKIKKISDELKKDLSIYKNDIIVCLQKKYYSGNVLFAVQITFINKDVVLEIDYEEMNKSIVGALAQQGLPITSTINDISFKSIPELNCFSKELGWNNDYIVETLIATSNNYWVEKTIRIMKKSVFNIQYTKFGLT